MEIGPGVQRVEFQYGALSFTAPEKVRFRYRLDGLDPDWVEAGDRRVAEYPNLPPGKYQFRVNACNEDGVWSDNEMVLAMTCLPAVWQKGWFKLLIIAIVLGSTGWVVKFLVTRRLGRRLMHLRQQHALEQERTRIARDIHDELGALLTEISLISDHSQMRLDQPADLESNLRRISSTAREAVQTADGIVWAITPRNDSFVHVGNYLVHFVEDFFKFTPIRCRLEVPANLPQIPLATQHRHNLLLAVKEACNNVVRHSKASEVWLHIAFVDNQFSVVIEDNGNGFSVESVTEGSDGLINIRQRMLDLGGWLEVSSRPKQGTRVKLTMPLKQTGKNKCPSK